MEFIVPGGYVKYEGTTLTGFGGKIEELIIPDNILIEHIDKKAFFGAKNLSKIILPATIKDIGQWAFASCCSLKSFTCYSKPEFYQGVFLNDDALCDIYIKEGENFASLLSAVCTLMEADYLLSPKEAGSKEWYAKFDQKLNEILMQEDSVGYEKYVLCGEEDLLFDINAYIKQNQKRKARLCYLRLIFKECLTDSMRNYLEDYLLHTACGCDNESGFLVLCDNADDNRYSDLYLDLGMLNDENFELTLSRLGKMHSTLKAKMIKHHDENTKGNFYDSMFL